MTINKGRWTADLEGDFVVFLIGADVRDPEKGPEAEALIMKMIDMLVELEQDPSKGLLGHEAFGVGVIVQYWRSFDALEAYARNPDAQHAPTWRAWNLLGEGTSDTGIWHETFTVNAGAYEATYSNMPTMGLQKAGKALTISEARDSARQRLEG